MKETTVNVKKKQFIAAAFAATLAFFLSACGGGVMSPGYNPAFNNAAFAQGSIAAVPTTGATGTTPMVNPAVYNAVGGGWEYAGTGVDPRLQTPGPSVGGSIAYVPAMNGSAVAGVGSPGVTIVGGNGAGANGASTVDQQQDAAIRALASRAARDGRRITNLETQHSGGR